MAGGKGWRAGQIVANVNPRLLFDRLVPKGAVIDPLRLPGPGEVVVDDLPYPLSDLAHRFCPFSLASVELAARPRAKTSRPD